MNTFGSALLILQGGEDGILSWSFTRAAAYVLCESRVFVEHYYVSGIILAGRVQQ